MKTLIISFIAIVTISQNKTYCQDFRSCFDSILQTQDFTTLKGSIIDYFEELEMDVYTCGILLDGFDLEILIVPGFATISGISNDMEKANLNLSMLQMLPPPNYKIIDSNDDPSFILDNKVLREVLYSNNVNSANIRYLKDGTISITIYNI